MAAFAAHSSRVSHSPIWRMPHAAAGSRLHSIRLVSQYAQVLWALISDLNQKGLAVPVKVVVLECGDGDLARLLLVDLLERSRFSADHPFIFVVADSNPDNLVKIRAHPRWRSLLQLKCLDFAVFEPEIDVQCTLQISGSSLGPGPLVVVADAYLLDRLPHDLFKADNQGMLEEGSLALQSIHSIEPDLNDPTIRERLRATVTFTPVRDAPYYSGAQADLNVLLTNLHAESSDSMPHFYHCVPVGAIAAVRNLRQISNDQLFVIAVDDCLPVLGLRPVGLHSNLACYLEAQGAIVHNNECPGMPINSIAFSFGNCVGSSLSYALKDFVSNGSFPNGIEFGSTFPVSTYLWLLDATGYDPKMFNALFMPLFTVISDMNLCGSLLQDNELINQLRVALLKLHTHRYSDDISTTVARLLMGIGIWKDAATVFATLIQDSLSPVAAGVQIEYAMCLFRSGRSVDARVAIDRVLSVNRHFENARELLRTIESHAVDRPLHVGHKFDQAILASKKTDMPGDNLSSAQSNPELSGSLPPDDSKLRVDGQSGIIGQS